MQTYVKIEQQTNKYVKLKKPYQKIRKRLCSGKHRPQASSQGGEGREACGSKELVWDWLFKGYLLMPSSPFDWQEAEQSGARRLRGGGRGRRTSPAPQQPLPAAADPLRSLRSSPCPPVCKPRCRAAQKETGTLRRAPFEAAVTPVYP